MDEFESEGTALPIADAIGRMKRAELGLTGLAAQAEEDGRFNERDRLVAKREGVRLARSYAEEARNLQ